MAPPAAVSGYHRHDGFYLRMFVGLSASSFSSTNGPERTTISGGGPSLGVALGTAIPGGLIIFGEFLTAGPGSPQIDGPFEYDVKDAELFGLGVGVAHYVMPLNLFVSAALVSTQLEITTPNKLVLDTRFGPALDLVVGKEWWIGADWGLGLAGQLWFATMAGGDLGPARWNTATAALAVSVTYN